LAKACGKEELDKFDFIAPTYVMPQDYALFQEEFRKNPKAIWIMKPVGKSQGRGIFLFNKLSQISNWKKDPRTNKDESDTAPEAYVLHNRWVMAGTLRNATLIART
jgi:tubulin polyglutamylase TTLL9